MPNKNDHAKTGFLTMGFYSLISNFKKQEEEIRLSFRYEIDLSELISTTLIGGCGGVIGSLAPDFLEPPTNPNHRGFFHSFCFMSLLLILIDKNNDNQNETLRIFLNSIYGGNITHLLQDSLTPKCINLI